MVLALLHESELILSDDLLELIVDKTFKEADAKDDGKIDEEEWKEYVLKNPSLINHLTLSYLNDLLQYEISDLDSLRRCRCHLPIFDTKFHHFHLPHPFISLIDPFHDYPASDRTFNFPFSLFGCKGPEILVMQCQSPLSLLVQFMKNLGISLAMSLANTIPGRGSQSGYT
ncbi:hypothetical protein Vadar_003172 [Vaccinium darrowii]|uniref:Uncharacterized protein n=1 Tax=Vaccinium darrowii TaxID=229202 RepID=A0ACB7XF19_9ERIC|nr:hypothetical protein Vadar_003172 [Vaccinium darrowii]